MCVCVFYTHNCMGFGPHQVSCCPFLRAFNRVLYAIASSASSAWRSYSVSGASCNSLLMSLV